MLEVNFTIILHSPFSNPLLLRAVLKVLIVAYCIPIYIYIYIDHCVMSRVSTQYLLNN